jgi:hypothetical protein
MHLNLNNWKIFVLTLSWGVAEGRYEGGGGVEAQKGPQQAAQGPHLALSGGDCSLCQTGAANPSRQINMRQKKAPAASFDYVSRLSVNRAATVRVLLLCILFVNGGHHSFHTLCVSTCYLCLLSLRRSSTYGKPTSMSVNAGVL